MKIKIWSLRRWFAYDIALLYQWCCGVDLFYFSFFFFFLLEIKDLVFVNGIRFVSLLFFSFLQMGWYKRSLFLFIFLWYKLVIASFFFCSSFSYYFFNSNCFFFICLKFFKYVLHIGFIWLPFTMPEISLFM